MKKSKLKTE